MNEDLLGECRACGQMVSKNLVSGCPHCGEAKPHLTEEKRKIEIRKIEIKIAAIATFLWFVVYGYIYSNIASLKNTEDLVWFLLTFCLVNPLTLLYMWKFLVDDDN